MSKDDMKEVIGEKQNGFCAISQAPLMDAPELNDTDRIQERFNGGTYTEENTRIVLPRAHMERHGILRDREQWHEVLKSLLDDRAQTMRLLMKINNQLLAYQRRTDHMNAETEAFLNASLEPVNARLKEIDKRIVKHMKVTEDALILSALGVEGVGQITVAGLTVYIDLQKADSPSALWSYVGLHKASHERYTKGEAGGGNKTLRTMLWNMANSMMKNRDCPYRIVYDQTKMRLSLSEKIVKTRNTQGMLVECAWKDTKPSHRHGAALRAMVKHFLADYWMVGRSLQGLSTRTLYVEEKLGHTGIIRPEERGWKV
jgi:hypothetical protein